MRPPVAHIYFLVIYVLSDTDRREVHLFRNPTSVFFSQTSDFLEVCVMGRFLKFLLGLALLVYLAPVLAGAAVVVWVAIAEVFGHIGP